MLHKICIIAIFSVLMFGCNFSTEKKAEEKPNEKPVKASVGMKEGDTVVARWSGNSFYEGKVEKIDDNKIKIKWNDGSNPSDIDKSDVYEIPKEGAKPDVAVGDMVLAKISTNSYWNAAEITKIDGDVYVVKAVGSSDTKNVDANKIIKVSAATAANLKDSAGSNDFLKAAQAKKPTPPKDFKAQKGDKVLAQWATYSWWSGKVTKVSGDKVTVAWDDGSTPSDVETDKVLPDPAKANSEMPQENQYVLAKPASGSRWVYSEVVGIKDKNVEIKDSTGKTRTVTTGEFVLLN